MEKYKLDWKKWKEEVDKIVAEKLAFEARIGEKHPKYNWIMTFDSQILDCKEKLTKLYSLRAYSRGRIHRKKALLTPEQQFAIGKIKDRWNSLGDVKYELNWEDQERFIKDIKDKYSRDDKPQLEHLKEKIPQST